MFHLREGHAVSARLADSRLCLSATIVPCPRSDLQDYLAMSDWRLDWWLHARLAPPSPCPPESCPRMIISISVDAVVQHLRLCGSPSIESVRCASVKVHTLMDRLQKLKTQSEDDHFHPAGNQATENQKTGPQAVRIPPFLTVLHDRKKAQRFIRKDIINHKGLCQMKSRLTVAAAVILFVQSSGPTSAIGQDGSDDEMPIGIPDLTRRQSRIGLN